MNQPAKADQRMLEPITSINITPLVDVSLVLVIIFMLTMPFLNQWALKIVPSRPAEVRSRDTRPPILVEIDRDGVRVDGRVTPLHELAPVLRQLSVQRGNSVVAISAIRELPHGEVVAVLDRIADAGVTDLALLQPREKTHGPR
jgi:biopolymer transport protein ExbD